MTKNQTGNMSNRQNLWGQDKLKRHAPGPKDKNKAAKVIDFAA